MIFQKKNRFLTQTKKFNILFLQFLNYYFFIANILI